jgi:integrase
VLQRAVHRAVRQAGIVKPATCHTFRHYAATLFMLGDERSTSHDEPYTLSYAA